jgi:hypothetical protein
MYPTVRRLRKVTLETWLPVIEQLESTAVGYAVGYGDVACALSQGDARVVVRILDDITVDNHLIAAF